MMQEEEGMTRAERRAHLKTILEAHDWRISRVNASVHNNSQAKHYAQVLWRVGVLNRLTLSKLLGCSRQTLYNWLPADGVRRMTNPKDFEPLRYLLVAMERDEAGEGVNWNKVIEDLRRAGVPRSFLAFHIGADKFEPPEKRKTKKPRKKEFEQATAAPAEPQEEETPEPENLQEPEPSDTPEEDISDDAHDLRPQNRADGTGHPEEGEGISIRLYKDPVDHGPGHRQEVSESDHAGDVHGPAARGADPDTKPDEDKSGSTVDGLLDPAQLSDADYIEALEAGTTWVQPGRQPFSVEPIDLDGDKYLEDLPLPPPSGELAEGFQAWEQAEEA